MLHRVDKLVHFGIFFIFGLLVYRALFTQNSPPVFSYKKIWIMLVIVIGYGIFDELHQGFTPGRSVDLKDLLADTGGGLLAGLMAYWFRNRLLPARENDGPGGHGSRM
jgi:VanZ family protein